MQKAIDTRSVIEARLARLVKLARLAIDGTAGLAFFVFVLDRGLKWYVQQMPTSYEAGVFSFGHFLNPALFFFPAWKWIPWVALAVLIAVLGFLILDLFRNWKLEIRNSRHRALFPIVLGGVSNVFDRFAYGGVIDILAIRGLGTFNLADFLIFFGLFMLFSSRNPCDQR